MCGRFNVDDEGLDDAYQSFAGRRFPGASNHNTAPTESAWIIRADGEDGALTAAEAKWWLTPYWSKVPTPRYATFNARAETLTTSRTFREPFRRRRCVVPVSGFYEWRKRLQPGLFGDDGDDSPSGSGHPYYVRPRDGAMLLAGVWDRWRRGEASFDSFAIVTTEASEKLAFLHHRQPLLLAAADAHVWLDAAAESAELAGLLAPRVPVELLAAPVSRLVGDARNKDRRCAVPVGDVMVIAPDR